MRTKIIISILAICCSVALILTGYFFSPREIRLPPDGLYFYKTQGYFAFAKNENVIIRLLFVSVHDKRDPFQGSHSFALLTSSGEAVEVLLNEQDMRNLVNTERYAQGTVDIMLADQGHEECMTFTSLRYINSAGITVVRELGSITVELLNVPENQDVEFINLILLKSSSTTQLMFDMEFNVINKYHSEIEIVYPHLGIAGAEPDLETLSFFTKNGLDMIGFEVIEDTIEGASPMSYVTKPKIEWKIGEQFQISTVKNPAIFLTTSTEDSLVNYLWEYHNENN